MLINVACRADCPASCLNCKWSDTVSATVCDLGKCAVRTFQDTSVSNYACLSTSPFTSWWLHVGTRGRCPNDRSSPPPVAAIRMHVLQFFPTLDCLIFPLDCLYELVLLLDFLRSAVFGFSSFSLFLFFLFVLPLD